MEENLFRDAIVTLKRNRTRTLLSGTAVAAGVFILLFALAGFNVFYNGSIGEISKLNLESVIVNPALTTKSYSGFGPGREWELNKTDIDALLSEFPGTITDSGPIYLFPTPQLVQVGNGSRDNVTVMAVYPGVYGILQMTMEKGRFIDDPDMQCQRKVCVIGSKLSGKWFGDSANPCGKDILVGNVLYTIVGVVKKDNPFINVLGDEEDSILLPYSTADAVCNLGGGVSYLVFSLNMTEGFEQRREEILRSLRQLHKVDPYDTDAANVEGMHEYSQMLKTLFSGTKVMVWVIFIGIILSSLLGIFGIMLLSVWERKNEIAVRLSIGAGPRDIVRQFVYESLVITVCSSMIGLSAAELSIAALRLLMRIGVITDPLYGMPQLSFPGIISVMTMVIAGGILSGYCPARKMAGKKVSELFNDIDSGGANS